MLIRVYRQFSTTEPSLNQLRTTWIGAGLCDASRTGHQAPDWRRVGYVAHPEGYRILSPTLTAKDTDLPVDRQLEVA